MRWLGGVITKFDDCDVCISNVPPKREGKPVVDENWFLESITNYQKQDYSKYKVQEEKEEKETPPRRNKKKSKKET